MPQARNRSPNSGIISGKDPRDGGTMDKAVIEGAPAVETGAEASFEQTTEDLSLRDYFAAQALGAVLDLMEDDAEEAEDFGSFAFSAAASPASLAQK